MRIRVRYFSDFKFSKNSIPEFFKSPTFFFKYQQNRMYQVTKNKKDIPSTFFEVQSLNASNTLNTNGKEDVVQTHNNR